MSLTSDNVSVPCQLPTRPVQRAHRIDHHGENYGTTLILLLPQVYALLYQRSTIALRMSIQNSLPLVSVASSLVELFKISDLKSEDTKQATFFGLFLHGNVHLQTHIYAQGRSSWRCGPHKVLHVLPNCFFSMESKKTSCNRILVQQHNLDAILKMSQKTDCKVNSPDAKLVIPGLKGHWVSGTQSFKVIHRWGLCFTISAYPKSSSMKTKLNDTQRCKHFISSLYFFLKMDFIYL